MTCNLSRPYNKRIYNVLFLLVLQFYDDSCVLRKMVTLKKERLLLSKKRARVLKRELLVVLTYLGTFSLNLRKRFYKSVSKSLPHCNIKVIFPSKNRLSSFFKFKDSIPLHLCSHLIYKCQCSNCNITYYGEIERPLKVRAGEQIRTLH